MRISNYTEKTDIQLQKESNQRAIRKLVTHRKNARKIQFDLENDDKAREELNFLLARHEEQWQNGIIDGVVFKIDYDNLKINLVELSQ